MQLPEINVGLGLWQIFVGGAWFAIIGIIINIVAGQKKMRAETDKMRAEYSKAVTERDILLAEAEKIRNELVNDIQAMYRRDMEVKDEAMVRLRSESAKNLEIAKSMEQQRQESEWRVADCKARLEVAEKKVEAADRQVDVMRERMNALEMVSKADRAEVSFLVDKIKNIEEATEKTVRRALSGEIKLGHDS